MAWGIRAPSLPAAGAAGFDSHQLRGEHHLESRLLRQVIERIGQRLRGMLRFLTLDGLCGAALAHSMPAFTARNGVVRVVMNPPFSARHSAYISRAPHHRR